MSSTELQLWMLAVAGIALAVFVIGFRWQARSALSRWALALLAAAGCAIAPALTARLDIEGVGPRPDLGHSLLVATAVVAAVALLALLTGRSRSSQHRPGTVPEAADGLVQLPIDADAPLDVDARRAPSAPDVGPERQRLGAVSDTPSPAPTSAVGAVDAGAIGDLFSDRSSDASRRSNDAAVERRSTPTDADALDLTETQRLFRDLRDRDREIDLPTDAPWLADPSPPPLDGMDTPDDGELIAAVREPATSGDTGSARDDVIEEAIEATLVGEEPAVAVDRSSSEHIATLAGGAPVPSATEPTPEAFVAPDENDVVSAADLTASPTAASPLAALQPRDPEEDVEEVGDDARGEVAEAARQRLQAERLADSEREGRLAAQALAEERAETIGHLRSEIERIGAHTADLEIRLKERDLELERAQRTARDAARLAREAATRRRDLERSLDEMRTAKARQQRATDRAVAIARNAIAALPASLAPSPTSANTPANSRTEPPATFTDASRVEDVEIDVADSDANANESYLDPYDR